MVRERKHQKCANDHAANEKIKMYAVFLILMWVSASKFDFFCVWYLECLLSSAYGFDDWQFTAEPLWWQQQELCALLIVMIRLALILIVMGLLDLMHLMQISMSGM